MEILIVKLSAIGDVIHTLPALDALHRSFPESSITWLVEEKASAVVTEHPYLKEVIVSKRKRWLNDLKNPSRWYHTFKEIAVFIREVRSKEYDVVIDFQGLLKSGLLILLSRGNIADKDSMCSVTVFIRTVFSETFLRQASNSAREPSARPRIRTRPPSSSFPPIKLTESRTCRVNSVASPYMV